MTDETYEEIIADFEKWDADHVTIRIAPSACNINAQYGKPAGYFIINQDQAIREFDEKYPTPLGPYPTLTEAINHDVYRNCRRTRYSRINKFIKELFYGVDDNSGEA